MRYESLGKLFYKSPAEYEQIYQHRFRNESSLHFDFKIHGNTAFLLINFELLHLMEKIWQLDKELVQICNHLPKIAKQQYITRAAIEEIKLTNEIEGIHSPREEIELLVEDKLNARHRERYMGFVRQYRTLMSRREIDLSDCTALRRLYDELCLSSVVEEDAINLPDGELFRKEAVSVMSETQKELHHGLYPERAIIDAMTKALYILNDTRIPVLIRIPVFHYMFAYIHPFYDGNGRLDRFISSYFLARSFHPMLGYNLSYGIKQSVSAYYKLFKETNDPRNKGDLTPFVLGFLEIIKLSAASLNRLLMRRYQKTVICQSRLEQLYPTRSAAFAPLRVLMLNTLFGYRGMDLHELAQALSVEEVPLKAILSDICASSDLLLIDEKQRYELNLPALLVSVPKGLPDISLQ